MAHVAPTAAPRAACHARGLLALHGRHPGREAPSPSSSSSSDDAPAPAPAPAPPLAESGASPSRPRDSPRAPSPALCAPRTSAPGARLGAAPARDARAGEEGGGAQRVAAAGAEEAGQGKGVGKSKALGEGADGAVQHPEVLSGDAPERVAPCDTEPGRERPNSYRPAAAPPPRAHTHLRIRQWGAGRNTEGGLAPEEGGEPLDAGAADMGLEPAAGLAPAGGRGAEDWREGSPQRGRRDGGGADERLERGSQGAEEEPPAAHDGGRDGAVHEHLERLQPVHVLPREQLREGVEALREAPRDGVDGLRRDAHERPQRRAEDVDVLVELPERPSPLQSHPHHNAALDLRPPASTRAAHTSGGGRRGAHPLAEGGGVDGDGGHAVQHLHPARQHHAHLPAPFPLRLHTAPRPHTSPPLSRPRGPGARGGGRAFWTWARCRCSRAASSSLRAAPRSARPAPTACVRGGGEAGLIWATRSRP